MISQVLAYIVLALVVLVAAALLLRRMVRTLRGNGSCAGCRGCDKRSCN